MNQNNNENQSKATAVDLANEVTYLRKRLAIMTDQKKGWHDIMTILIPLIIVLVTVLASFYQNNQMSQLKFEELKLRERQLDDALDPKIIEALLDDKTKKNAIALGNGLYVHNSSSSSAKWWCAVVREIESNNPSCLEFTQ